MNKRVKTPLLLQLEAVECGAACLGIILEYHGRIVPLSELRVECGVSRDGVKAGNMTKAARKYGMKAKGFRETRDTVAKLKPPFIAFWDFNHFLVVEHFDFKNKVVYLNDPAHGHRKVTFDEFDTSFTGVVLLMEPDEGFQKGGTKLSFLDAIKARLKHCHSALLYLLAIAVLLTVPGIITPAFTRIYLDHILTEARSDWLQPLVVAIAVTVLFKLVLEFFKFLFLRRLKIHLAVTMSSSFFWHLLKLPMQFYAQRYGGEIATRQNMNSQLADVLSGKLADTCLDVLSMFFYAILMFYYNVSLTLVGLAFASINFIALHYLGERRFDANIRLKQDFGKVYGVTIAALQAMESIKASGQEASLFSRFAGRYAKAVNSMQDLQVATQTLTVLPIFFSSLSTVAIYLLGGRAVIEGNMSIGTLVAFTALMSSFQTPIKELINRSNEIQEIHGDLRRLDDVLDTPAAADAVADRPEDQSAGEWPLQLQGRVTLQDITFGYSPVEDPLFEDVTIDIPPGHRVAFVGGSGSGKTTLAYLICGLYEPWKGTVLMDSVPRSNIPRDVMVHSFSMVSQDITIFEGTVRDNLTLWDRTVPDDVLVRACEDAAILDAVLAIPGGLDGPLLEGGANLSGGQRQRLEIARALVQNPSILVLDEATSALDAETEGIIVERLRLRGCTCIVVAHRLSTIRDCDEIIVLDRGKIAERGVHEKLWGSQGLYAELLRAGEGAGTLEEVAS
ncbi:MAG TPA: NHLP family bacteriocin export ABC transporter peptidase/permease/ATPase subunit [Terriglobia bacterium]